MLKRLAGASLRGVLVALLILFPGWTLPAESGFALDLFWLLSLVCGVIVTIEYLSAAPSLIEFRFFPPYNRMRFGGLCLIVLAMVCLFQELPTVSIFYLVFAAPAKLSFYLWDFQYSPVVALAHVLGRDDPALTEQISQMAALALTMTILLTAAYCFETRGFRKPLEEGTFNIYLNLPLPTSTLVADNSPAFRLYIFGVLSIVLGLLLPVVVPFLLLPVARFVGGEPLAYRPMVVWVVTLWAWGAGAFVLRGVALLAIARKLRGPETVSS